MRTTIIENKPDDILDFIVNEIFSAENMPELTKKYSGLWAFITNAKEISVIINCQYYYTAFYHHIQVYIIVSLCL